MYLLLIGGALFLLAGILLAVIGIRQGRVRISSEEQYPEAEATVESIEKRWHFITVHVIIPVAVVRECRPVLHFWTQRGEEVRTTLDYTLPVTKEYRAYRRAEQEQLPLLIRYDPDDPAVAYYGSKTGFRVREVLYKLIAAALLMFIGIMLIRGHFLI